MGGIHSRHHTHGGQDGHHTHGGQDGHHPHPGAGPAETVPGPTVGASVVLDIGPHAGALVLYAPATLDGAEVEIRPHGGEWRGTHTAVRARQVDGQTLYAGVFGSLEAGPYDLRVRGGGPHDFALAVEVSAGAVAEASVAP